MIVDSTIFRFNINTLFACVYALNEENYLMIKQKTCIYKCECILKSLIMITTINALLVVLVVVPYRDKEKNSLFEDCASLYLI